MSRTFHPGAVTSTTNTPWVRAFAARCMPSAVISATKLSPLFSVHSLSFSISRTAISAKLQSSASCSVSNARGRLSMTHLRDTPGAHLKTGHFHMINGLLAILLLTLIVTAYCDSTYHFSCVSPDDEVCHRSMQYDTRAVATSLTMSCHCIQQ